MTVCRVSNQIAEWGKIGGFGTATRALGSALVRRGIDVTAVVVGRPASGQQRVENLDGIKVFGPGNLETLTSGRIYREINADNSSPKSRPSRAGMRGVQYRIANTS